MSLPPQAVLFDLDGTLLNTFRLYREVYRRTLEPHFSRRLTDAELEALNPQGETPFLLGIIDEREFTAYFELFLTHYAHLHESLFEGPYEGILAMLGTLKRQGHLLGIVTGKSREAWRITSMRLEDIEFEDLFDVVLTDDDVAEAKPSPEGLLLALDMLNVDPDQAIFIGDSQLDREAAEAAEIPFGAALWAHAVTGAPAFAQPASREGLIHRFRSPQDIVESLRPR